MKSRWRHSETTIFGQSWAGARSAGFVFDRSNIAVFHSYVIEITLGYINGISLNKNLPIAMVRYGTFLKWG
jgi:hypothetical protein